MIWKPHVTVAALCERENRFLLVEERIDGCLRLNQPAGHLEPGESLCDAVIRETREETGWDFAPQALVGIYRWPLSDSDTYLRFCFTGACLNHHSDQPLDEGIEAAIWLSHAQLANRSAEHRSPLVMRCVADYLAGQRYPLTMLMEVVDLGVET